MKNFGCLIMMLLMFSVAAFAQDTSVAPAGAAATGDLVGSGGWRWEHDGGTPGSSVGSSVYPVSSPSIDRAAREFYISYSHHGGERYHLSFARDAYATHFLYDTYVYITNPSQLANLELDMNQVMPNGRTVIYGVQCSSYSNSWEFATVSGGPHWHRSNLGCNPKGWAANKWHHVQIASHRNSSGYVTYDYVSLDGSKRYFSGAGGYSSMALGWAAGDLLLNVQFDGASSGSGSIKAYFDRMIISRW